MLTCAECSERLLDYLYGLLDEGEAAALRNHLAECPGCQLALAAARADQDLLARAARKYPTVPEFRAPAEEPGLRTAFSHFPPPAAEPPAAPAPLPRPARTRAWRRRLAVAAAAAVLFALGTLYAVYQHGLAQRQKALDQARKEVEAVDARLVALGREVQHDRGDLEGRLRGQFLHVKVLGPASYLPAAPSPYRLTTQDVSGQAAPAQVLVKVVSRLAGQEGEQVLFSEEYRSAGELRFTLPANLAVQPAARPRLVIEARSEQALEVIEQPLAVEAPTYLTHLIL